VVVMVTVGSKLEAEKIVQGLLEDKLVACANILGPVNSHFRWEGKIECVEEFLVLMKSRLNLFAELSLKVKALHSYEVPEIVAFPLVAGSESYFSWLDDCLK
jgi:periplasmic divalent cation tolerance protein